MYTHDWPLTSFPVSAALTYISDVALHAPALLGAVPCTKPIRIAHPAWGLSEPTCTFRVYIILPHLPRRFGSRCLATTPVARKSAFTSAWGVASAIPGALPGCLLFPRRRYLGGTNENNICMRPPTLAHQRARASATTDPFRRFALWLCCKNDGLAKLVTGSETRSKNRLTLCAVIFIPFR